MSTYSPDELLSLWTRKKISVEMAIGHILQNLVKLHKPGIINTPGQSASDANLKPSDDGDDIQQSTQNG
ncbi:hypothetical protein KFU94_30350 [Chloroflexi bacterium TSY]|nr:hypothetical protein [Chloroflexi bacterium TSY]